MSRSRLLLLESAIVDCRQCPRLVEWREQVAVDKRLAYREETYWGRPVPGFGDPDARLIVIGLAPAAHGANRTGRMFTGDRSGDWLFRAMHRAGFASAPESQHRDDGLTLSNGWVTAPVRCAPPANRPSADERERCAAWFDAELELLESGRVFVVLGQIAYHALWSHLRRAGHELIRPRPPFVHGAVVDLDDLAVVMSYHPSQQNTFTGRLTEEMFDAVFSKARTLLIAADR